MPFSTMSGNISCISEVAGALLLQDRHRNLGQVVEHQVIDRPLADLIDRRGQEVAPKALTASHANNILHRILLTENETFDTDLSEPERLAKSCSI